MQFIDVLRVLLRRWYVVVAGILLVGAASGAAIVLVPTAYQASAQVLLLLPPTASGETTPTNPLLNLQGGLTTTAALVAGNLTTKDVQREIEAQGHESGFAIGVLPSSGPLLAISTSGTDPIDVIATRDELLKRVNAELAQIQSDPEIPRRQIIRSEEFSVNKEAEALPGSKIRALAVIVAVGGTITLLTAFGVDRFAAARESRVRGRRTSDPVPPKRKGKGKGKESARTVADPEAAALAEQEKPAGGRDADLERMTDSLWPKTDSKVYEAAAPRGGRDRSQ